MKERAEELNEKLDEIYNEWQHKTFEECDDKAIEAILSAFEDVARKQHESDLKHVYKARSEGLNVIDVHHMMDMAELVTDKSKK